MHKYGKIILLPLTGLLVILSLFPGCSINDSRQIAPRQIKIGLVLYQQDDSFISLLQQSFEAQAKAREMRDNIKITVNIADSKGNQGIQNELVDKFLAQGTDVLCVNCVDRTAASVIIDKAKIADIPVVFFNREPVQEDIQRWDKVFYIGSQTREMGQMEGEIVLDAYLNDPESVDRNQDGKLQYVMLEGEAGHQDALIRTEYSVKVLTQAAVQVEKLANQTANWQRSPAAATTAQWIEKFGSRIEVVFCNNDDMALGALDAYQAAGITDLPLIVGTDATPPAIEAIRAGLITGTVLNDYNEQAGVMLKLACALASDENISETVPELEGQYFLAEPKVVTIDHLEETP